MIFDDDKKDFEMAHGRAAAICPPFENALAEAEPALRQALTTGGLASAPLFACLWDQKDDWVVKAKDLLALLKIDADEGHHLRQTLQLYRAASEAEEDLARRNGLLTGLQISADLASYAGVKRAKLEEKAHRALALSAFAHLPAEWRGKRYRRVEGQPTEDARAEGE